MTIEERKQKQRENHRRWRSKNKEKLAKRSKGYITNWILKRKYGIGEEEYNRLLLLQSGCCAICKRPSTDFKRKLHVDHNHTTGKIRGLLCVGCNSGLGNFQESLVVFDLAREYLVKHSSV